MKKRNLNIVTVSALMLTSFLLAACTPASLNPQPGEPLNAMYHTYNNGIANNKNLERKRRRRYRVPSDVQSALVPRFNSKYNAERKNQANPQQRRFNISVNNVPARQFFAGLVSGTSYSIVVEPSVKGSISLSLKNVTITEALNAARSAYGYEYERRPYGFLIKPRTLATKVFTVNYLNMIRQSQSQTTVNSSEISNKLNTTSQEGSTSSSTTRNSDPSTKVTTRTTSDFWVTLKNSLIALIGDKDGRKVITNPSEGLVIVRAYPNELKEVGKFLDDTESVMDRQVIIQAKVLEVNLNSSFSTGINWSLLGIGFSQGIANDATGVIDGGLKTFKNIFTLTSSSGGGDFSSVIKLLATQGNVQLISSPRISTLNNQKAVIKVGTDEFFITDFSNTILPEGNNTAVTQDLNLTPFFSGVALDVTPEISKQGEVMLHIHPIISKVTESPKVVDLGNNNQINLPLAKSTIRESDSVVRAKSGQIVVIGGLMLNGSDQKKAHSPWLNDLPIIGHAFENTQSENEKSELIILLRPIVVGGTKTWNQILTKDKQQLVAMKAGRQRKGMKVFLKNVNRIGKY